MRVISFQRNEGSHGVGVMTDDSHFVDANKQDAALPGMLRELLARPEGLAQLQKAVQGKPADGALNEVTLLPVIPDPHAH
mgnify:FL=1